VRGSSLEQLVPSKLGFDIVILAILAQFRAVRSTLPTTFLACYRRARGMIQMDHDNGTHLTNQFSWHAYLDLSVRPLRQTNAEDGMRATCGTGRTRHCR
jgi:hypothetical protein